MKKKSFYAKFKNIITILLVGIIFFSSISSVYAQTLTIQEVDNKFKELFVNELGSELSTTIDETNKKLEIKSGNDVLVTLKYDTDYIEYDNRNSQPTQENATDNMIDLLCIGGIIEAVLELSGYENKTIKEADYSNTFDTYGFELDYEEYEFKGEEDGSSWSISGDYIKYLKLSLDTEKIKALMNTYGTDASTTDPNKDIINSLTPSLRADDITDNSITLYPQIPFTSTNSDYAVFCDIYRSDSENGNYEKISDAAVNCLDSVGLVDNNLKSNTTYYYKTVVTDGTKYSNVLAVTTKDASSDGIDNPQTGAFFNTIIAIIIMLSSIWTILYVKKKSLFKKV